MLLLRWSDHFGSKSFNLNKTGLQPVSRPVERVRYLGGWSPFDAIAVQTVTLLAILQKQKWTGGASGAAIY